MRPSLDHVFAGALASLAIAACGGPPLFGCMNGVYGPPHYRHSVKELPPDVQTRFEPGHLPDTNTCRTLCDGQEHCQIASIGRTNDKAVVCHVFYKGGCPEGWGSGRFMEGLSSPPPSASKLERMAYLEAASVIAFENLAEELGRRDAPSSLVERACMAARDEERHARLIADLAHCDVPIVVGRAPRHRSTLDLAIENAVEGCTFEFFGALLLKYQSLHAADARVREVLQTIARDEQAHAELALDLHQYFLSTLPFEEAAQVKNVLREARRSTFSDDETTPEDEPSPLRIALGLPSSADRRRLAYSLFCEDPGSPVYAPRRNRRAA